MMNMIDYIERLERRTEQYFLEQQLSQICFMIDYSFEPREGYKFAQEYNGSFTYDDYNLIAGDKCTVFIANGLMWNEMQERKRNLIFKEKLIDLITKNDIKPFLFFVDGRFIPWSKITIVHDYHDTYIIAEGVKFNDDLRGVAYAIPFRVYYNEVGRKYDDLDLFLSFNTDGTFNTEGSVKFYIDSTAEKIDVSLSDILQEYTNVAILDKYVPGANYNALVFKDTEDGVLLDYKTKRSYNVYNMLSLEDKESKFLHSAVFSRKTEWPLRNIYDFDITYLGSLYKDYLTYPTTKMDQKLYSIAMLSEKFDYNLRTCDDYGKEFRKVLEKVFKYNASYMSDYIKQRNRYYSVYTTGDELIPLIDDDNTINISRAQTSLIPQRLWDYCYVMIFINGYLYTKMHTLKYTPASFTVDMVANEDIHEGDDVELIYIINVNNRVYGYTQEEYKPLKGLLKSYGKNINVFTDVPVDPEFDIDHSYTRYPIEYTIDDDNNIELVDEELYNGERNFYITEKERFCHVSFVAENIFDRYMLPTEFAYCRDKNNYLIFVNGRKIDSEDYRIVIPTPTTPFTCITVYFTFLLNVGETVSIYYMPYALYEITNNDEPTEISYTTEDHGGFDIVPIPYPGFFDSGVATVTTSDDKNITLLDGGAVDSSKVPSGEDVTIVYEYSGYENASIDPRGFLHITRDSLDYPVDPEIMFIFINGKKVPTDKIITVNSTTIRIPLNNYIEDLESISIMGWVQADTCITELFRSIYSIRDRATNSLDTFSLEGILKQVEAFPNDYFEPDTKRVMVNIEALITEIVRDFYMKPNVNDGQEFLYDYDSTYYTNRDSKNTLLIPSLDAVTGKVVEEKK